MRQTGKFQRRFYIRNYSILTNLHRNRFSVSFIIIATLLISLLAVIAPRDIQKYAFFLFGIPVIYASLVLGFSRGVLVAVSGFGAHLFSSKGHFVSDWVSGRYMTVLVEGIIIVVAYFLSTLFISKILVNEREARIRYKKLAGNYALVAGKLQKANENVTEMFTSTIKALAAAIDAKDTYTKGHSERVTEYAVKVAREMGLSGDEVYHIMFGAILHDIGKIGIDERILRKPESLSRSEYRVIKRHPEIGAGILSSIRVLEPVIPIVLHHHERFDGRGYPAKLNSDEIPVGARIVAVVDAYDALTSNRPYRSSTASHFAVEALRQEAGQQFDPKVLKALEKVLIAETTGIAEYQEDSVG